MTARGTDQVLDSLYAIIQSAERQLQVGGLLTTHPQLQKQHGRDGGREGQAYSSGALGPVQRNASSGRQESRSAQASHSEQSSGAQVTLPPHVPHTQQLHGRMQHDTLLCELQAGMGTACWAWHSRPWLPAGVWAPNC